MRIGTAAESTTRICTSNAERIVVHGHDLVEDLVGKISFVEHAWLLMVGDLPNEAQRKALDATLVSISEHGLVPSVQASRMTFAAAPDAMQGAVAAGILGCGSVILGAAEDAGRLFSKIDELWQKNSDLAAAAEIVVKQYRSEKRPIPGYGHPLHKGEDPRAVRLLEIGKEIEISGRNSEIALHLDDALERLTGKPLKLNVSGAIPAILLDAGFPLNGLKGVPILARTASLIGHLLEEQLNPIGFKLSEVGDAAIQYTGTLPAAVKSNS